MATSTIELEQSPSPRAWTRTADVASRVGLGGFVLSAAVTGFATTGYQARREAISALAAKDSPHAWLMMAGFVMGGIGLIATGILLWHRVPRRSGHVAAGMVGVAGLLVGLAGLARQDCSERLPSCRDFGEATKASGSFLVHQQVSMLAFALLILSFFVLARGLRHTGRNAPALASTVIGAAAVVLVVLLVTAPPVVDDNYGLLQRAFVLLLFGWPWLCATRLLRG